MEIWFIPLPLAKRLYISWEFLDDNLIISRLAIEKKKNSMVLIRKSIWALKDLNLPLKNFGGNFKNQK